MPKSPKFEMPICHLNGDRASTLVEQYDKAGEAFYNFIKVWEDVELNARNYYPKGPDSFTIARSQRDEINKSIRSIRDYIDEHQEYLHDQ